MHVVLTRWDEAVVDWQLSRSERSLLLGPIGVGPAHEVGTYEVRITETRLRLLVELAQLTREDVDRGAGWLRQSQQSLAHASPLQLMAQSSEWTKWFVAAWKASR